MEKIRRLVEDSDHLAGKLFDVFIQSLIIISLFCFAMETLPGLSVQTKSILSALELGIIIIFTVEILVRFFVSKSKKTFFGSLFTWIDLVAIVPFYLTLFFSFGLDLRSVRAFRLLRLFQVLKMARFSAAARRFHVAFRIAQEELVLFLFVTVIILYLSAAGIYHFENPLQPEAFASIFHSLWWSVATLTTVGYGDVYPITTGGKVLTFFVLMVGLGIVSIPAGLVASALSKAREQETEEVQKRASSQDFV